MYFNKVNPIRAFLIDPVFSWYYFINSGIRALYLKLIGKKLRLKYYGGGKVINAPDANEILKEAINKGMPFMFGRYGSSELNCVTQYLLANKGIIKEMDLDELKVASNANGLFPINETIISKFGELMIESSGHVDLYGTFRMIMEDYYIRMYMKYDIVLSHLYMMDFWQYEIPFTFALKGKKVLVIHPFADTIESQYYKRIHLFSNQNILPEFELKTIVAVQTIAGQRDARFTDFFEALEFMYQQALEIDFEIALIGCGAYGFPLAAKLKQAGKIAIQMGGVTQMLFGIKGSRWDDHPIASKLYNEHWVRPKPADKPENANTVEGGCYW